MLPPQLRLWRDQGLRLVYRSERPAHEASRVDSEPACACADADSAPQIPPVAPPRPSTAQAPWPAPWNAHLRRVKPNTTAIWTYWELAHDLGSAPSGARRELWGSLLREQPSSSVVSFWPLSVEQDGDVAAAREMFWRGVRHIGAPLVIAFGHRAHTALLGERPFACKRYRCGNIVLLTLPGPAELLAPDGQALDFVRAQLAAPCG